MPPNPKLQQLIDVHGQLTQLIAPATPASIRASSVSSNSALKATIWISVISFILLLLSITSSEIDCPPSCSKLNLFTYYFGIFGAAGLGATFHALTSASEYLRSATFDPRYNQTYLIRLCIGICAGFILGFFANDLGITGTIGHKGLALIGGFSAEAVVQILKRIAETLVAAIRGNEKDHAAAEADKQLTKKKMDVGIALQEALTLENDERQNAIKRIIKDLSR